MKEEVEAEVVDDIVLRKSEILLWQEWWADGDLIGSDEEDEPRVLRLFSLRSAPGVGGAI